MCVRPINPFLSPARGRSTQRVAQFAERCAKLFAAPRGRRARRARPSSRASSSSRRRRLRRPSSSPRWCLHKFYVGVVVLFYDPTLLQEVVVFCGIYHGCQLPPGTQKSLEGVGPGGIRLRVWDFGTLKDCPHLRRLAGRVQEKMNLFSPARTRSASAPTRARGGCGRGCYERGEKGRARGGVEGCETAWM